MRPLPSHFLHCLIGILSTVLLAGCGAAAQEDGGDEVARSSGGSLAHVDGIIVVQDEELVLTPADGDGEDMRFRLGPEVEVGALRAIEASGAPARVTYRPGEEPPTAAAVSAAPTADEGEETYEGRVVSVDERRLVVAGPDGKRTFDVSAAEEGAFDVHHLEEHADQGEPIRVYFDPARPDVGLGYEDA